jgi:intracellular sulfur oxidation DsrE/DsrF family protein
MKKSAKITIMSVFLAVCLITVTAGDICSEEYSTLKGLKSVKAVFDFELGNPQSALIHLQVIHQTFKDKNIWMGKKKPDIAVVFIGPSVKLVSKNRGDFSTDDQKILNEFASTISAMAKDGIKFEICLIAVKVFGVEPSSILPEIKQVGNGWISLIGYETRGYALVPVSP